jgi:hypothetical protein
VGRQSKFRSLNVILKCFYILIVYFVCLSFKVKVVGGGPTASHFFSTAKKSNQKMP